VLGEVNFADTLRAEAVSNISQSNDAYYLLSITGIANPTTPLSTLAGQISGSGSYVLFVDEAGQLRFDSISKLEFEYDLTPYNTWSPKIAAVRQASWCVQVNRDYAVQGSNAVYDFTNLQYNKLLEAPLNTVDPNLWQTAAGEKPGSIIYNPAGGIDLKDDEDLIVSGWHFSQTYGSQQLQTSMPLYSYVEKDSVLVFVIEDPVPTSPGNGEGGYKVTVKYVAVNDLIADAAGNVRIGADGVKNVLLFTIKKLDKFVLNANDYNAIRETISFNDDAYNQKKENDGWNPFTKPDASGVNPHAQGTLTAFEVNDSLYRYGYLQFQNADDKWLYVDTAYWNVGNDEFLAFNWSDYRRDTAVDLKWGEDALLRFATPSTYYVGTGKPDSLDYFIGTPYEAGFDDGYIVHTNGTFWRLDSLIWGIVNALNGSTFTTSTPLIWPTQPGPGRIDFISDCISAMTHPEFADLMRDEVFHAANYMVAAESWNSIVSKAIQLGVIASGDIPFWPHTITMPINPPFSLKELFVAAGGNNSILQIHFDQWYIREYEYPTEKRFARITDAAARDAAFHSDSLLWVKYYPFARALDSIVENQSKFRVVYDPYVDSTYINVYQSRVRYTDYKNSQKPVVYPWWKNSFYFDGTTVTPNDNLLNRNSIEGKIANSAPKGLDTVLISTADTLRAFHDAEYPLSHIYGWSNTHTGTGVLREDSLLYVDIQNLLTVNDYRIVTLDQSKSLDTHIKLGFAERCNDDKNLGKATIDNDLYLIRNAKGEYLCVPIYSITDSVYWKTPEQWEDPTKMPSYQWVVENMRNSAGSPFTLTNREFRNVSFEYVQVLNEPSHLQIGDKLYSGAGFAKEKYAIIYPGIVPKDKALKQGEFSRTKTDPALSVNEYSFLPLALDVKQDQLLGYNYIDPDATFVDVYALKYLHFLAGGADANYLGWNGFDVPKIDSAVYVNSKYYHDKLYFTLQEMPYKNIGKERLLIGYAPNGAKYQDLDDYKSIYDKYGTKEYNYVNRDSIVMEHFGYMPQKRLSNGTYSYDFAKIEGLNPLARQAYRLLLKDYYKFSPTLKGDYLTVGGQDKYVLSDATYALNKSYVPGSKNPDGIFGIPYFYFRKTYFEVPGVNKEGDEVNEDYFALVQRLDTVSLVNGNTVSYNDVKNYIHDQWGPIAAERVTGQIRNSQELGAFIAVVDEYGVGLKIAVRGESATTLSTFTLEQDADPLYRRFKWNDYPLADRTKDDIPLVLEFKGELRSNSVRFFENSGGDTQSGGGKDYNLDKNGNLQKDSLGNIISFLGVKNDYDFLSVKGTDNPHGNTNYAFYVDTAFINRGTGWIKPQYMFVVDPHIVPAVELCVNDVKDYFQEYKLGRYLYNTSMYAKKVTPSAADVTKYGGDGVNYDLTQPVDVDKIHPAVKGVDGYAYTRSGNTKWERLAFAWAIHRGDELWILKGVAPEYQGKQYDAELLDQELRKEFPAGNNANCIDFSKLRAIKGQPVQPGKIGLHAIINLADNTHKDWVFSFRFIQRNSDNFIIESETEDRDRVGGPVIAPGYGGWVKYDNNVPIISRTSRHQLLAEGYVMNVQRTDIVPVSNDPVDETSEVAVYGGVASVAVLNASGKAVVITNALGQVLANTVITSDNATIAVPASGIVFVAVDGETVSKVLVK
jgi:hypothetical protein